jgi:hypothetical protein
LDNPRFNVLINEQGIPSPSFKVKVPAFKVISEQEMPSPSQAKWTQERLDKLVQWPHYKPLRDKTQMLPPHLRNNAPMTM